jgi:hypothetical protein
MAAPFPPPSSTSASSSSTTHGSWFPAAPDRFSTIKTLRSDPAFVMPDRGQVTMEQPFLRAYTQQIHVKREPEPLRRRPLPRSRRPLRPDVDVGGLRGVPDAARLRFAAVIVAPRRA